MINRAIAVPDLVPCSIFTQSIIINNSVKEMVKRNESHENESQCENYKDTVSVRCGKKFEKIVKMRTIIFVG